MENILEQRQCYTFGIFLLAHRPSPTNKYRYNLLRVERSFIFVTVPYIFLGEVVVDGEKENKYSENNHQTDEHNFT